MGANLVRTTATGTKIENAFDKVRNDAEDYSGHQEGYSGDFNVTYFGRDVTHMLKKMLPAELDEYIIDNCPKGETWGYCIEKPVENKNKVKSSVEAIVQKGTRSWKTMYKAIDQWSGKCFVEDISQTACIKKARAFVERNPEISLTVIITKDIVVGNQNCAKITYKKSEKEKPGLYRFIGWASC